MSDIAILVYPGCMGVEVLALADIVLVASHLAANMFPGKFEPVRTRLVKARSGEIPMAGGIAISATQLRGTPGLLVVPGLEVTRFGQWDDRLAQLRPELAAIRRRHATGAPIAGICVGSFLLAEAGILAGRRATTAWPFVKDFQARYPLVELVKDAVVATDDSLTTTGAVSSAFDLALLLVKNHFGEAVARAAGKLSLVDGARVSQQPYFDPALIPREHALFSSKVQQWLRSRLSQPYKLASLARAFHMTERTILRRYRQETGSSPLKWLQQTRIDKARHLLERSSLAVSEVITSVGYQDLASFSKLFSRETGQTPGHYRRRHRAALVESSRGNL